MKRALIIMMLGVICCSIAFAQRKNTVYKDSVGNGKITMSKPELKKDSSYTPEYIDTTEDGVTVESESTDVYDDSHDDSSDYSIFLQDDLTMLKDINSAGIVFMFFFMLLVFGFPIFVIFIAFYFRYKSRRERYKLVEKAIAAGQPIPESILKESLNTDTASRGIKNMCLGAGLCIFLWAITDSFAMGSIGLLIMFTGLGQWLVSCNQHRTDKQK